MSPDSLTYFSQKPDWPHAVASCNVASTHKKRGPRVNGEKHHMFGYITSAIFFFYCTKVFDRVE